MYEPSPTLTLSARQTLPRSPDQLVERFLDLRWSGLGRRPCDGDACGARMVESTAPVSRSVTIVLAMLTAGLAVISALALGPGYPGYDAAWALVWGGEIAGGELPDYRVPFAPTPHPLANLVAVPLS